MSRYDGDDDEDFPNQWALWETTQRNALRGRKGQVFLRELKSTLEEMPAHRLIDAFVEDGEVCALGAVAVKRRVDAGEDRAAVMQDLYSRVSGDAWGTAGYAADTFKIPPALAHAVAFTNDEEADYGRGYYAPRITPEERWQYVYRWVCKQLGETPAEATR